MPDQPNTLMSPMPSQAHGSDTTPPAPHPGAKYREERIVWPRDMNSPSADEQPWGRDPEGLRDA
ncbi:hypothetical protein F0U61_40970 [Archangium violaceum]|jgi:hypothetical protein|uniref:hypothetical protein n=1 Tax=Archangium violaceum TaxID=83451 RepID=UPI002B2C7808|nr:hypothetical protein F0U61_40970 [Archangium violaceum]